MGVTWVGGLNKGQKPVVSERVSEDRCVLASRLVRIYSDAEEPYAVR